MRIILNKNINIGKVVFFVEGEKTEKDIIINIFNKVLGYNVISYNKNDKNIYEIKTENNPFSKVFVIPMNSPAANRILTSKDYIEYVYKSLKDYSLVSAESAKYFIFDRDNKSNDANVIQTLINKLKDAYENDDEMGGLVLLSYPCIEAFICSLNKEIKEFRSGFKIKNI